MLIFLLLNIDSGSTCGSVAQPWPAYRGLCGVPAGNKVVNRLCLLL